jgi:predicted nucleic acid-binding protein
VGQFEPRLPCHPVWPVIPIKYDSENLVEVRYRIERDHGRDAAEDTLRALRRMLSLRALRRMLSPELPGTARVIEVARLKARSPIALADCFAMATAAAHGLLLLTGDPELLQLEDPPCQIEDLRAC